MIFTIEWIEIGRNKFSDKITKEFKDLDAAGSFAFKCANDHLMSRNTEMIKRHYLESDERRLYDVVAGFRTVGKVIITEGEEKKYRTSEQWDEICDSAINGNWTRAGEECVKYGFWANDLIKAFEDNDNGLEGTDLALLSELAMKQRWTNMLRDTIRKKEQGRCDDE